MKIALMILAGIGIFLLTALIVRLLWNWLVPTLFKGPRIQFGQALGVLILSKILFGFGGGMHSPAMGMHGNEHCMEMKSAHSMSNKMNCAPYVSPKSEVKP
jgi:hypothetical protein